MQTVVIVVHLMIVATLIATVLLQKSEGGGLGVGGWGARLPVEPRHRQFADAYDRGSRGGLFSDQPAVVLARQLRPQAQLNHRQSCLAVATGRSGDAPAAIVAG